MNKIFNTLFLFLLCASCYSIIPIGNVATNSAIRDKILYSLDFSNTFNVSDTKEWLEKQGFDIKKDPSGLDIYYDKGSLVFDSKEELFFYALKTTTLDIKNAKKIRITWGVNSFPENASYEKEVNNEGLMVYIYYGTVKLDSGSFFIPNSPYFIGLFLSKNDKIGKYYIGRHFKKGGRFVCLGTPKIDETVISEFDLQNGFKNGFGKDKSVPPITGLGLEVETTSSGPAKAFIKKIEILG